MKKRNMRVKGFTLTEMIVVIAIIGVLAGVLAPTMITYYQKSRVNASNADAKMIYNAAQTAVQKYISRDRTAAVPSEFKKDAANNKCGIVVISYNGDTGAVTSVAGTSSSDITYYTAPTAAASANCQAIADTVNRNVSGANITSWAVCVENYIVKGCISAKQTSSRFVGYYSANKTIASDASAIEYSSWFGTKTEDGVINRLGEVCEEY